MTIHAAPFFSFLWKEVTRRGGDWPRETVSPHSGKPTPPRFARLPLPKEGARMIFKETLIKSSSFAVRDSRSPTYAARFSAFLICLSCRLCPIRPCGAPSPRGEGCDTRIPSSKKAAHHPCEPIHSPSTVIPSAAEGSLLHCRHMYKCVLTQTTPWCFLFRLSLTHVLPVCKKAPSTSALITRKKDRSSHIVFHTAA